MSMGNDHTVPFLCIHSWQRNEDSIPGNMGSNEGDCATKAFTVSVLSINIMH